MERGARRDRCLLVSISKTQKGMEWKLDRGYARYQLGLEDDEDDESVGSEVGKRTVRGARPKSSTSNSGVDEEGQFRERLVAGVEGTVIHLDTLVKDQKEGHSEVETRLAELVDAVGELVQRGKAMGQKQDASNQRLLALTNLCMSLRQEVSKMRQDNRKGNAHLGICLRMLVNQGLEAAGKKPCFDPASLAQPSRLAGSDVDEASPAKGSPGPAAPEELESEGEYSPS